jgi:hypothetical protein
VSSALAIAGVTAVLRDLLNDGLVNHNVGGVLGSSVIVSTLPPDKVVKANDAEATQLNLFLRHVTPNLNWRNEGRPSRDAAGRTRLSNPPLALNLHYLVSAYGSADLHAEILLGYAMQLLHENPALTRDQIRVALQPSPDVGTTLPPALRALAESGLQDQIEQLVIKPEFLNTEEMSKFWTATLAHYRPSAAYEVSVVLIQAEQPAPRPLPVLARDIHVNPNLLPLVPHLTAVVPAADQPFVQLGALVTLVGSHLAGTGPTAILTNDRFQVDEPLAADAGSTPAKLLFTIPAARAGDFPAGVYRVGARVQLNGDPAPRTSNQLALTLAPLLTTLPAAPVLRDGAGTASFSVSFTPAVRTGQTVRLVLGAGEFAPLPFANGATTLAFVIPKAPVGTHLARLRIDGIDSPVLDPSQTPPVFLDKRIEIQ